VRLSLRVQIAVAIVLVTGAVVLLVLASSRSRLVEEFSRFEGGRDTITVAEAARRLQAWYPRARGWAWVGADSVLATVRRPVRLELLLVNAAGTVAAATRADLRRARVSGGAGGVGSTSGAGPGRDRTVLVAPEGGPRARPLVLTMGDERAGRALRLLFDSPPNRALHGADGRLVGVVYSLYMPRHGESFADRARIRGVVDRGLLLPLLLGALASMVLLLVTTTSALSPLRALTAATRRLAAGDRGARVPVTGASEVAQLSAAFNGMAAALERAEAARRQMVSDVAHELRTPLTNLRCRLEAIQDGLAPADAAAIQALHDETLLLSRLVEDLQLLSLADAGALALERRPEDLRELAARAIAAMQPRAETAGVALALVGDGAVPVAVDAVRIGQVLRNLLANAIEHTPRGGQVSVRVGQEPSHGRVEVSDTGAGIAPEHLAHLFERFWRADPSRARGGTAESPTAGAGLGLAIVRQLVELHGGDVSAHNEPGAGACFGVRLPLAGGFTASS
jgi:two-component system sensor histidine kinase BaeS